MDGETRALSEVSQTKKKDTNKLIYRTEIVTDVENTLMVSREKGRKDKLQDWD